MEITKEILLKELKERINSQSISTESVDSVVETLFSLIKSHVTRDDVINIKEFSVRMKGYRKKKNSPSHRHSQKDSSRSTLKKSSNFILNELFLMLGDSRYLGRKVLQFGKSVVFTTVILAVYYYILSVLIGC